MKTEEELAENGFTQSGVSRFTQTVEEYGGLLYTKAVTYGDADKDKDLPREVTHDHVRAAAHTLAGSFGKHDGSRWFVVSQAAEYVLTALSAYSLAEADQPWGTPVFVVSAIVAGILVTVRVSRQR